jgi:hypothetical protein
MKTGYKSVLDDLLKEREQLDRVIAYLDQRAGLSANPTRQVEPEPEEPTDQQTVEAPSDTIKGNSLRHDIGTNTFSGMKLKDASRSLLAKVGRPLKLSEMAVLLRLGGLQQRTLTLESNLNTIMKSHPESFAKLGPATWVSAEDYP